MTAIAEVFLVTVGERDEGYTIHTIHVRECDAESMGSAVADSLALQSCSPKLEEGELFAWGDAIDRVSVLRFDLLL